MKRSALPLVRGVVRPRAQMAQAELSAALPPGVRDVSRSVVGHHLFHDDALLAVPVQRPFEEGDGVTPAVGRKHLRVGEAGVVVDGDVHVVPSGAPAALDAVAVDALADVPEASELLRVDVQQLAGAGTLVAHHWRTGLARQTGASQPPEHLADGGGRPPEQRADRQRSGAAALARRQDLGLRLTRQPPRLAMRHRRALP